MKKRKVTKKERKAQRAADHNRRGAKLLEEHKQWDRVWQHAQTHGLAGAKPQIVAAIHARDIRHRADELTRDVEAWPNWFLAECASCGYVTALSPFEMERPEKIMTCMDCQQRHPRINRTPSLDQIDDSATQTVTSMYLANWIEDHTNNWRDDWGNDDYDLTLDMDQLVEWFPEARADTETAPNPRTVDWRTVAKQVAAWLDQHPREINVREFAEDLGYVH